MSRKEEQQERFDGMPGPPQEVIDNRVKVRAALHAVHEALNDLTERMPAESKLTFHQRIKGDLITVTIQPGKEGQ